MTWNQLLNALTFEIRRNPHITNEPALVWLHDDVKYSAGEHEVSSIDPPYPDCDIDEENRLSLNLNEWYNSDLT